MSLSLEVDGDIVSRVYIYDQVDEPIKLDGKIHSKTVNKIKDVFTPNSNYLEIISNRSRIEINKYKEQENNNNIEQIIPPLRDSEDFNPIDDNFNVWVFAGDVFEITF